MIYDVGKRFIKIEEFSGTVYNNSFDCTIEMSTKPVAGSGTLIYPNQSQSFRYHETYLRCIDGTAEVECIPYDLDPSKKVDGDTFVEGDDFLHLTFDFPTGSNKTMLLRNPRPDLTVAELQNFSEYVIEKDIFRNEFAEPILGLKKILMIKSMVRGNGGGSSIVPVDPGGDESDIGYETTITYDTRRKLSRGEEIIGDLRRILATEQTLFTVDLLRHVKWRWLTRILPDSSFLDPKMYAAADALDDQITRFHWAIKNVLHLPRLGELKGTVLDLLADQFHVDAYDAINFDDETKRELIRTSIAWHRIKGTPAAVEKILAVAFQTARIEEWFEYGGAPYYFRMYIKGTAYTPGSFQSFWRMFWDAKNVRSHLEKAIQNLSPDAPIKAYVGVAKIINGSKTVKARQIAGRTSYGIIFTGAAQRRTGVLTVKPRYDRPTAVSGKLFAGGVTVRTGTKSVGMYQAT